MKDWKLTNANGDAWFGRPADIDYDESGDIATVEKMKVLEQNLKKMAMTGLGFSTFDPQYGTAIAGITGMKLDPSMFGSLTTGEMTRMIAKMQTMMRYQAAAGPEERIASIDDIGVENVSGDPRKVLITSLIRTEDENTFSLQTTVQKF
jgi:hypothetical protein